MSLRRNRDRRRFGRSILLAGTSFVAVLSVAIAGVPDARTDVTASADDLDVLCTRDLAPGAEAFWLDGQWWCGGVANGLWTVRAVNPAGVCDDQSVADVTREGVRCDN
jgi:hypothetical protein